MKEERRKDKTNGILNTKK